MKEGISETYTVARICVCVYVYTHIHTHTHTHTHCICSMKYEVLKQVVCLDLIFNLTRFTCGKERKGLLVFLFNSLSIHLNETQPHIPPGYFIKYICSSLSQSQLIRQETPKSLAKVHTQFEFPTWFGNSRISVHDGLGLSIKSCVKILAPKII